MAVNLTPEPTQQDSEMDLEEVSIDTALLHELARPRKRRNGWTVSTSTAPTLGPEPRPESPRCEGT